MLILVYFEGLSLSGGRIPENATETESTPLLDARYRSRALRADKKLRFRTERLTSSVSVVSSEI